MKKDRYSLILEILDEKGSIQVSQLAAKLGVSEVTVRSDLKILSEQGLLKRVHGGACRQGENLYKGNVRETVYRNTHHKMLIAGKAFAMLHTGDTVLLDDSSTCLYLAKRIAGCGEKKLNVLTNSVFAAVELLPAKHVSLFLLGGEVSQNLGSTSGQTAESELKKVQADYCFIGANGITADTGATVIGYSQMKTKQAMMSAAGRKILLADSHKFGQEFSSVVAPLSDFDAVITDGLSSSEALEEACRRGNIYIIREMPST